MTQTTKLYYNTRSVFSSVIRLYLHEKGLTVDELVHIDLAKGEQNTPEFHSLNPQTKVPVFVHGSEVIPDSREITSYIEKTFGELKDLAPTHTEEAARTLHEIHQLPVAVLTFGAQSKEEQETKSATLKMVKVRHENLKKAIEDYPGIAQDLTPKLQGMDGLLSTIEDFPKVQDAWKRADAFFTSVDALLEGRTFLDGDKYTYIDSHFTPILSRISFSGQRQKILQYPNLARYWETVQARESYKTVFDLPCSIPNHPKGCTCR
ncbi:thioredoxin-like protein [Basidiobolus meristosporus CBS 931.73]|uniref:Thioredoxin-like protein n=1 Tax=Basidiobolus meristosporus CBS 931.73 TaxID=1314790 RepID=A0A1Y1Y0U0_9FUNG|nr:thioredoxin-like protein [Basidiobolus meristosporus CBS 931.73]|eukprot:ORX91515.1 thioredoxin-like protein [Basidiobolus meristosporus CBS 931.73]